MGLLDFIEKLQRKPQRTREKILAASVAVIMLLIALVWFKTLRQTFSAVSDSAPRAGGKPFEIIGGLWNQGLEILRKEINF